MVIELSLLLIGFTKLGQGVDSVFVVASILRDVMEFKVIKLIVSAVIQSALTRSGDSRD